MIIIINMHLTVTFLLFPFLCLTWRTDLDVEASRGIDERLLQDLTTDTRHIEGIGLLHQRLILLINEAVQSEKVSTSPYDDYYVYDLPQEALTVHSNGTGSKLLISGATLLRSKWPKLYAKLKTATKPLESVILVGDENKSYVLFSFHQLEENSATDVIAYRLEDEVLIEWIGLNATLFPSSLYSSDEPLAFYRCTYILGQVYEKLIFYGTDGAMPNSTSALQIKQQGPFYLVCQADRDDPDYVVVRIDGHCQYGLDWMLKEGQIGGFIIDDRLFSLRARLVITFEMRINERSYLSRIPYEQFLEVGMPVRTTHGPITTTTEDSPMRKDILIKIIIGIAAGLFVLGIVLYLYCVCWTSYRLDDPGVSSPQDKNRTHRNRHDPKRDPLEIPPSLASPSLKLQSKVKSSPVSSQTGPTAIRAYHDSKGKLVKLNCKHSTASADVAKLKRSVEPKAVTVQMVNSLKNSNSIRSSISGEKVPHKTIVQTKQQSASRK